MKKYNLKYILARNTYSCMFWYIEKPKIVWHKLDNEFRFYYTIVVFEGDLILINSDRDTILKQIGKEND